VTPQDGKCFWRDILRLPFDVFYIIFIIKNIIYDSQNMDRSHDHVFPNEGGAGIARN